MTILTLRTGTVLTTSTPTPTSYHSTAASRPALSCASHSLRCATTCRSPLTSTSTTLLTASGATGPPTPPSYPPTPPTTGTAPRSAPSRYNRHHKQWLNVSPSPQSYLGGGAVWSGSRELVAGWTDLSEFYLMPEVNQTSPQWNDEAWCYTTLEHVEWELPGELTFTYVCNGRTFDSVLKNDSIYVPQLVRMPYPTIVNPTAAEDVARGRKRRIHVTADAW